MRNKKCAFLKVATDTTILYLRTRYRTILGWFFWFWPIQGYDTTKGKWQILYLRTRYRSKLGWFFWFGPIHVTIRRNLGISYASQQCLRILLTCFINWMSVRGHLRPAEGGRGRNNLETAEEAFRGRRRCQRLRRTRRHEQVKSPPSPWIHVQGDWWSATWLG